MNKPPLIAHIIYKLNIGGLENGLVNLINKIPSNRYLHVIICLKDTTNFSERINNKDVRIFCLNKREGHDINMFFKLYKLLCDLNPEIVHTRNLATLECQLPAYFAGVERRVHGEHGWDLYDPYGTNVKYQWLRRCYRPLIHRYIPLSFHLEKYLIEKIGVPNNKIRRIINGVDTDIFHPAITTKPWLYDNPFSEQDNLVLVGTVGRMQGVKDQMTLVEAFLKLLVIRPELKSVVRLVLVGDGPLRNQAISSLAAAGVENLSWLPGERNDVADILRNLDIFVLPSTAEGISNVILESMATGLPVIATSVGGNPDLVENGVTGKLVESSNPQMMAEALAYYFDNPDKIKAHGSYGLIRVHRDFSLDAMVNNYVAVYDELMLSNKRK
jgi:sugar transferase (PEP-CTERM/EpsH1 system associated)